MSMQVGNCVKVDFTSESSAEFSGTRFTGRGAIDRLEDGRVFGRLDDGRPFMCFPDDVEVIPAEACEHGYDVACLLCGFGSIDGERVWHSKK